MTIATLTRPQKSSLEIGHGSEMMDRRGFLLGTSAAVACPAIAGGTAEEASALVRRWFGLILQLVRHTPTYSPPVAARTFGYLGIGLWETFSSAAGHASLAGASVDNDRAARRPRGLHLASALHGALDEGIRSYFSNTGPSGRQAFRVTEQRLREQLTAFDTESAAFGSGVMRGIVEWSAGDGGAEVRNLGFDESATVPSSPQAWVPTSAIRLQQSPLLPSWGNNRPIALKRVEDFLPLDPLPYSDDAASDFYAQAREVYDVSRALTDEERLIARFWSDDPMLTPTPPGHWFSIILQIAERDMLPVEVLCDAIVRVGISQNDAFIACWRAKYLHNLLRPVTYIQAHIDPAWQPLLITPPFPEYPSGHSSQSAAAAEVLTALLGENFAFDDATHVREGLPARSFPSFRAASAEAAMSRLYGGIHFRYGNEQGTLQGVRVAEAVMDLKTL